MNKTKADKEPKVKKLQEQKTDFTNEGAPPPGKAGTSPPVPPVTDTENDRHRDHKK